MGAIVVSKGKVVGKGFNYAHGTGKPHGDGSHAEIAALNNTTAKYRKNSTVYVVRVGKDGSLMKSKPCDACNQIMSKMGVKYAWYINDNGCWCRMKV